MEKEGPENDLEALEERALRLPPDQRAAFMAAAQTGSPPTSASMDSLVRGTPNVRLGRLLELLRSLASERNRDRLLERITESAVELSGADWGLVLLADPSGQLVPQPAGAQQRGRELPRFSESIAQAVLIDGQPILSVDAGEDAALHDYQSVHLQRIRSVACLPIQGPSKCRGVLYLENRKIAGRFGMGDLPLLQAFADQAALAIENAALHDDNERTRRALEQANAELAKTNRDLADLLAERTQSIEQLEKDLQHVRSRVRVSEGRFKMVGASPAMQKVFETIDRVRQVDVPVVVYGESGTGKELVARAIHEHGLRSDGPFVAVNCGALTDSLLESELFGHARGAFTGAATARRGLLSRAHKGTLFLDEAAAMPPKMQVDLLRVLQDGRVRPVGSEQDEIVDVRILCASNQYLQDLVKEGRFREDLFYRLSVVEIRLPALRERAEDIPLLVDHILQRLHTRLEVPRRRLTREAMSALEDHPLTGNVRQLEHLLYRASVLGVGPTLDLADLQLPPSEHTPDSPLNRSRGDLPGRAEITTLADHKQTERRRLIAALNRHDWNRAAAAREIGMPRRTFYRRLTEYGILGE